MAAENCAERADLLAGQPASMRPRRMAAENPGVSAMDDDVPPASMRPRRMAAENGKLARRAMLSTPRLQ